MLHTVSLNSVLVVVMNRTSAAWSVRPMQAAAGIGAPPAGDAPRAARAFVGRRWAAVVHEHAVSPLRIQTNPGTACLPTS